MQNQQTSATFYFVKKRQNLQEVKFQHRKGINLFCRNPSGHRVITRQKQKLHKGPGNKKER